MSQVTADARQIVVFAKARIFSTSKSIEATSRNIKFAMAWMRHGIFRWRSTPETLKDHLVVTGRRVVAVHRPANATILVAGVAPIRTFFTGTTGMHFYRSSIARVTSSWWKMKSGRAHQVRG